jgi:hypothetical protein
MGEIFNWVEAFEEEQSFDQPCKFGNRVGHHSVYCHCEKEGAPRKCRYSWYNGHYKETDEHHDSKCPFFIMNDNKEPK